jgi:hypothetical protein
LSVCLSATYCNFLNYFPLDSDPTM